MAGELKATQLSGALDAKCVQLFGSNASGPMIVSVHDAVPPGFGDSIVLITSMPYKARLAYAGFQRTGGDAAAGNCKLNYNIVNDISPSIVVDNSLLLRAGLAVDIPKGATVNFTRDTPGCTGNVICFWILLSESAASAVKTNAIDSAFTFDHLDLTIAAGDIQLGWISSHVVDNAAAPGDVQLFNANFPVNSKLIAVLAGNSSGGAANSVELRTAAGGAGDAISEAFDSVNRNNIALGSNVAIAAGASLYARATIATSYNWILCIWKSEVAVPASADGALTPGQFILTSADMVGQADSSKGLPFVSVHTMDAAGPGADDITLFAAMPRKAGVCFAIESPTQNGDAMGPHPSIRNAAAGAGDALCDTIQHGYGANILTTLRCPDVALVGNSVAAGAPSYLYRPKGLPKGDVLVFWMPMA